MLEPAIPLDRGWPWVMVVALPAGPGDDDDDDDDPNTGGSGGNIDPDEDEGYDDGDDEDDDEEPLQVSGSRDSFAALQHSVLSCALRRPAKFDGCPPQLHFFGDRIIGF
jgi:hypothetical protein